METPLWHDFAICKGQTDLFFASDGSASITDYSLRTYGPSKGSKAKAAEAAAICAECPVQVPCLEASLVNREGFGTWGGMAWYERRKLLGVRKRGTSLPPGETA